jgi:hypothetical protein
MRTVPFAVHNALFRLVDHGLAKVGPWARTIDGPATKAGGLGASPNPYVVSEFAAPDGTVAARRVQANGLTECWLRADLADLAERALAAELAENARIAAIVTSASVARDIDRAKAAGMTLEAYRLKRNHALAKIDQRRGKNSIGL